MAVPKNSSDVYIQIDGVKVANLTDIEFNGSKDTPEYTNKDSGANVERMSGVKDHSGSMSGFYVDGDLDALIAWYDGTATAVIKVGNETSGEEYFSFAAHCSSYSINSPSQNQPVTWSANFVSTGARTKADNA